MHIAVKHAWLAQLPRGGKTQARGGANAPPPLNETLIAMDTVRRLATAFYRRHFGSHLTFDPK